MKLIQNLRGQKKNPLAYCSLLGLAHGLADAGTGLLLFSQPVQKPEPLIGLFLLYNLIAFALQPAAGALIDDLAEPRSGAVAGLLLLTLGLSLWQHPAPAILLTAMGSALFHAGAGALAGRAGHTAAALFTAPGVLGLAIGTAAGLAHLPETALLGLRTGLLGLLLLSALLIGFRPQPAQALAGLRLNDGKRPILLILLLLTAIALRSFVWSAYQILIAGNASAILLLGAGAAVGKLLGGPLAIRYGWKPTALVSLLLAIPLLSAGSLPLLVLGVAALQLSTPITLHILVDLMPERPATAAGLVLGLALALGGTPLMLNQALPAIDGLLPLAALLLLGLMALVLGLWHKIPSAFSPGSVR